MADRGASGPFLTELAKSTTSPCFLLEVRFDSGTLYLTDAWRGVVFGGHTYVAAGHFLNFEGLTESAELQVEPLSINISAVDQTWISDALTEPYLDRRVLIYKALLDSTQSAISSPILIFDGLIDGMSINDDIQGEDCIVTINANGQFADFDRVNGRHTNSASQQIHFPTDLFFDYVPQLGNKTITWGSLPVSTTPVASTVSPKSTFQAG